jgi:putative transport protein
MVGMPLLEVLVENPLLQVFVVVGLGALLGIVPFGPIRFGAAGALFVGLAIGALDERLGEGLGLVQSLGLALFVYCVGLAGGSPFVRGLRTYAPMMAVSVVTLVGVAALAMVVGLSLGVSPAFVAGVFAGAGNSTPALQAALDVAGTNEPSVGYSLAYPVGVATSIAIVAWVLRDPKPGRRDPAPAAAEGIVNATIRVARECDLEHVPGRAERRLLVTMLRRDEHTTVVAGTPHLLPGDEVLVVGPPAAIDEATAWLGAPAEHHLVDDRSEVTFRRMLLSNGDLAGVTVADLGLEQRFGAVASRVRRADLDMLALPDTELRIGDRLRVVVPAGKVDEVSAYLGDSERRVNELDLLTLGIGLTLGLLVGLPGLQLGDIRLSLGAAAGPLIVGMVLGALRRTGPLTWEIPLAANQLLRQLGVAVFLACVGLAAGREFADQLFTGTGVIGLGLALLVILVGGATTAWVASRFGASSPRVAGLLAGYDGQPAVLSYANDQVMDERIDAGYATLFALDTIAKIVIVQLVVVIGLALL